MTVTSTTKRTAALPGNGTAITFSFSPMVIYASTDLEVYLSVVATGIETLLTEGTGASNYKLNTLTYPHTGSITYPALSTAAEMEDTHTLTIVRKLPITQTVDLTNQAPYNPETQEEALDIGTIINLQQQEELNRSVQISAASTLTGPLELPLPAASTAIGWNAAATGLGNISSLTGISLPLGLLDGGTGGTSAASALDAIGLDGASAVLATGDYADNSVTLAKMAGGTDGNLIGIDASGDPAYIATGAANTVLTSGGVGVASSFAWPVLDEDTLVSDSATSLVSQQSVKTYVDTEVTDAIAASEAAAGGITEIIAATSLPVAATVDLTIGSQQYASLILVVDGASSATASRVLTLTLNTDTTAGNYFGAGIGSDATSVIANEGVTATMIGGNTGQSNTAAQVTDATCVISGYQVGGRTHCSSVGSHAATSAFNGQMTHLSTAAITKLVLGFNGSGNFDAGTYALYGVQ